MNSVRSNNLSLKYQRFTQLGCKDIGNWKSETALFHLLASLVSIDEYYEPGCSMECNLC